jgi:hypothetical protein
MVQRLKIISSTDAGAVVNQVNKLLMDGWQILSEHSFAVHAPNSGVMLVPCFVVFLTREED